jgi:hypothetical protein
VASWQAEVAADDVQQVVGSLSPRVIGDLLAKVSPHSSAPPGAPTSNFDEPTGGQSET